MKMSSGIDITKLDLFPLLGAPDDHHGFVANVFDYTCSGRKFRRVSYQSGNYTEIEYDRPDQVGAESSSSGSSEKIKFVQDVAGAKKLLMKSFGLDYGEEYVGAFSSNSKYLSLLKQHFELDKVFAQITFPTSVFHAMNEISLDSRGRPSVDFIQRAAKLPAKYEDNPAIYHEFVQHFGTHYIWRAIFTYDSHIQFALNRTYYFDTEKREIEENIKQSYIDWFKGRPFMMIIPPDDSMLNYKLKRNSEIILAYGHDNSIWDDKVSGLIYVSKDLEIFREPVMSYAELKPIDKLIGLIGESKNSSLQSQVKIAIRMYRIEAYLSELKNVYNFSADYYQLSDSEQVTLDKVEKLVNSHNVTQMDQMVEMIDELYQKVQLFKRSDGEMKFTVKCVMALNCHLD